VTSIGQTGLAFLNVGPWQGSICQIVVMVGVYETPKASRDWAMTRIIRLGWSAERRTLRIMSSLWSKYNRLTKQSDVTAWQLRSFVISLESAGPSRLTWLGNSFTTWLENDRIQIDDDERYLQLQGVTDGRMERRTTYNNYHV